MATPFGMPDNVADFSGEPKMDLQLQGRCALVTGASQGIGRAIAIGLAREGVKVAVVARRRHLLDALASEIVDTGGESPLIIEADFYPENAARREFSQAEIPAGRFGNADEIGNLAIFLSSPLAGYITDTVIPVDGGMSRFAF